MKKIAFIGAGNMASAIWGGVLRAKIALPSNIILFDKNADQFSRFDKDCIKEENIENFYDEIDCLILPSRRETFGLEALEAMSCGKIVVVSSRCGARDIIEPHNNGFIFDITKNPERNLSRVLQYILVNQDDFENLRQKAVYTASVYNFEKFKTELIRILQKFAQNNEAS